MKGFEKEAALDGSLVKTLVRGCICAPPRCFPETLLSEAWRCRHRIRAEPCLDARAVLRSRCRWRLSYGRECVVEENAESATRVRKDRRYTARARRETTCTGLASLSTPAFSMEANHGQDYSFSHDFVGRISPFRN